MRKPDPFLAILLAAGSTVGARAAEPVSTIPVHGATPGHACRGDGTTRFIGKAGTSMMGAAIRHATGAAVLRWAPAGAMLTMDFRPDRVTVYLDQRKKITRITCG